MGSNSWLLQKRHQKLITVMGTKMQLKSYLPEFCAMRDLNEDSDSSWSQYHGDRASGRQFFGHAQQTRQSNRYLGCERESIKQTMLAQNATFRNQGIRALDSRDLYSIVSSRSP
ncbi:uncharacterized protein M6B38_352005 [Iris pallida]|uniref:Uncharacterized protein n=1 Tax=Iris pallida TaxID=29817 RepID=A0AAX6GR79_IRIPA|nr:uncharacterized protein M6B38_352005 [Iris pallida]